MSTIRLFNEFHFVLPADPGDANSQLALTPQNVYFGTIAPYAQSPNPNEFFGINEQSNVTVKRWRYTFMGAAGLRPNPQYGFSGVSVNFHRRPSYKTNILGQNSIYLPWTVSSEWEESEFNLIYDPALTTNILVPEVNVGQSGTVIFSADTRNLQSLYYGQDCKMRLEIDCVCSLTDITI